MSNVDFALQIASSVTKLFESTSRFPKCHSHKMGDWSFAYISRLIVFVKHPSTTGIIKGGISIKLPSNAICKYFLLSSLQRRFQTCLHLGIFKNKFFCFQILFRTNIIAVCRILHKFSKLLTLNVPYCKFLKK